MVKEQFLGMHWNFSAMFECLKLKYLQLNLHSYSQMLCVFFISSEVGTQTVCLKGFVDMGHSSAWANNKANVAHIHFIKRQFGFIRSPKTRPQKNWQQNADVQFAYPFCLIFIQLPSLNQMVTNWTEYSTFNKNWR